MKFIHISNLNIGKTPDEEFSWGKLRKEEIIQNFERMIKICNDENTDVLLIAGNLFDGIPTDDYLSRVNLAFCELKRTKVFIITGKSDYMLYDMYNDIFDKNIVHVFEPCKVSSVYIEDIDTQVYGASMPKSLEDKQSLDNVTITDTNRINILLMLGTDESLLDENLDVLDEGLDEFFENGINYVALGKRNIYHEVRKGIVYPGSLEVLDMLEAGIHGYVKGEVDNDNLEYELVPFSRRNYHWEDINVDIHSTSDTIMCYMETIANQYGIDDMYSLQLVGQKSPCEEFDFSELKERYNIIRITDKTEDVYDFDVIYETNKDNIIGEFITRINSMDLEEDKKKKALFFGLEALSKKRG